MKLSKEDNKRLREIWRSMRKRCENRACKDYPHYGARGISVCDEWSRSFESFARWAMEKGYSADMTLDRMNNNRGYSPGNCRWVSRREQAYNRTTNRHLYLRGRVRTLEEWSEESGVPAYQIVRRIDAGWSEDDAVFTPLGSRPCAGKEPQVSH